MARQRLVPESFGEIGHYRADAVGEVASLPVRYAGYQVCVECHEEQTEAKQGAYHRTVSCETCHGPSYDHAVEDMFEYTPAIPRKKDACMSCHSYLPSRPTGFPQIIELQHHPMEPCVECHNPHDPTPSEVPGECSACHGQIARTKAISHHSRLNCETCHVAPPEHKENPRLHLPSKPQLRESCGRCHSPEAEVTVETVGVELDPRAIPRVVIGEHGNSYDCWQCHYPHFPEGN